MSKYFDLATAIFALIAAGFWWASAGKLPPMRTYWDAVPPSDPYRIAVETSARRNSIAAFFSGLSALCAFAGYLTRQ
jgi:hypothetical protein